MEQSRDPMNKNRIRGLPGRTSERVIAKSRAIKGREGKSGGDAAKGEARNPDTQGTEARTAHAEPERPETPSNRRVRTRTHGGVGGEEPRGSSLSRLRYGPAGDSAPRLRLGVLYGRKLAFGVPPKR